MFDERDFITKVEAADARQFAELLRAPRLEEERALRTHFGDGHFEELQQLVLDSRTRAKPHGNVMVLHGIMGSELAVGNTRIWIDIFRLIGGSFARLKLDPQGRSEHDVRPLGMLKKFYGKQLLTLGKTWRVRSFAYDWRLDVFESAKRLHAEMDAAFGADEPVHLVAHSMGGLVARAFIVSHPQRWEAMWDREGNGLRGGRLIMLGTPNHGSFAISHLYLGLDDTLKKLALLDFTTGVNGLLDSARTFVGTYQMLPSAVIDPKYSSFLQAATLGLTPPNSDRLQGARDFPAKLADAVDPARMAYIAGSNRPTPVGVKDWNNLKLSTSYEVSRAGDGTVPHEFGKLRTREGAEVPMFYIDEEHGRLPNNAKAIAAVDALLRGKTDETGLSQQPILDRGGDASTEYNQRSREEQLRVEILAAGLKSRSPRSEPPPTISKEERDLEALLLRQFASDETAAGAAVDTEGTPPPEVAVDAPPGAAQPAKPSLRVRVWKGSIGDAGVTPDSLAPEQPPIDAVAVGHYLGVRPINAELALDEAISAALPPAAAGETIIVQMSERGLFRGELGQPFFLPDPRENNSSRVIAIAGMGVPGRFNVPELKVLTRELGWSLQRLRKKHLATVLIGSGVGNIDVAEAVEGWLLGLARALGETVDSKLRHLELVTFVENSADRAIKLFDALMAAKSTLAKSVELTVLPLDGEKAIEEEALREEAAKRTRGKQGDPTKDLEPSRLTVEFSGDTYVYGALTEEAAIPERHVSLDQALVYEGVDRLVAAKSKLDQEEFGEYVQRLLLPHDFREALAGEAPLVIVSDNETARVPWEMLTQPAKDSLPAAGQAADEERFLGLRRGLTRQLRTRFAPPPEPPPPAKRVIRFLLVADPSAEHPLAGAREEGWKLQELLNEYNEKHSPETGNHIDIKALIGPGQATRSDVLRELLLRQYDVLHYAGHCEYNEEQPELSGWIFSDVVVKGKPRPALLTANELQRIDRVPRLIVANACESGVLPERAELRNPAAAPGFAEAFFARGVADFVCTAWPVNDAAALDFASTLYRQLLGFDGRPQPMHVSMREARRAVHKSKPGLRSWGAYQHYGNPNYRLFR